MKILYAIQATGNGHISRAMELLPYLNSYGKVDVFLSGQNSHLPAEMPITYKSKGYSLFYSNKGGLNYLRIAKQLSPIRLWHEIKKLPVEQYDLILNDFESITAMACAYKKIPSVHFGHQASFVSPLVPLPVKKDHIGHWVLKNYAKATQYIGLHFKPYDAFILPPVIRKEIWQATPTQKNYITVYLPAYSNSVLLHHLQKIKGISFQVFSGSVHKTCVHNHISLMTISKETFTESLIHCSGIITSAGFETPAEALYLQKKLLAIPIKGQYEQQCNAAALTALGLPCLPNLPTNFTQSVNSWLETPLTLPTLSWLSTEAIVEKAMGMALQQRSCLQEVA